MGDYHLINLTYGARELRRLGDLELKYLAEVMLDGPDASVAVQIARRAGQTPTSG